jgi:hypothetical protein
MRPEGVAAEPLHEAKENEGLLFAYENAVGEDALAAEQRSYGDEKRHVQNVLEAGVNESSTAQRRAPPGYPRFETRGPEKLDWRSVTIVSPLFCIYTMSVPSLATFFTQALCQLTAPLCVLSILIILSHSFATIKACS